MFKFGVLTLVVVLLLIIGPLLTIWALNTLFPALAIPHTFTTWLSVIVLASVLHGSKK